MNLRNRKAFTLIEIIAASAIMTMIVLGVLVITSSVLRTWSRSSGQIQTAFDAGVVGAIMQEDLESIFIKKDGKAWLQVAYPINVGMLQGEDDMEDNPLRPPEIMFYSPTLLRPRYTRENIGQAAVDPTNAMPIPGSICAIKYQISLKSPFMASSTNPGDNATQYNAFYGFYRAVIDPKSTVMEAMGETIQGFSSDPAAELFRNALEQNLWSATCTVIDEEGLEQPGVELRSWALAPENLIVTNMVDFRVTFGVFYPDPDYTAGSEASRYKLAYIPPGSPFTVGPKILTEKAYEISNGARTPIDPRLIEDGFLAFVDVSMTILSDAGAKEMRAMMANGTLDLESFKRVSLSNGNTITRRIQFMAEPTE